MAKLKDARWHAYQLLHVGFSDVSLHALEVMALTPKQRRRLLKLTERKAAKREAKGAALTQPTSLVSGFRR